MIDHRSGNAQPSSQKKNPRYLVAARAGMMRGISESHGQGSAEPRRENIVVPLLDKKALAHNQGWKATHNWPCLATVKKARQVNSLL